MDKLLEKIETLEKQNKALSFAVMQMKNSVELPSFLRWCIDNQLNSTQVDFITDSCTIYSTIRSHEKLDGQTDSKLSGSELLQKLTDHYLAKYPDVPHELVQVNPPTYRSFDTCIRLFLSKAEHGLLPMHYSTEELLYSLHDSHLHQKLTYALLEEADTDLAKYYLGMIKQEGQS